MNILALVMAIEMGWIPMGGIANYEPNQELVVANNEFYIEIALRLSFYGFYMGGTIRSITQKRILPAKEFIPLAIWYNVEAGWKYEWITIGWDHECDHPIVPWFYKYPGIIKWEGGWDELFVRATLRLQP